MNPDKSFCLLKRFNDVNYIKTKISLYVLLRIIMFIISNRISLAELT